MADEDDLPWITEAEHEQMQAEIHFLQNSPSDETPSRDQAVLNFEFEVLDRYRGHRYVTFERSSVQCMIKFIGKDGKEVASLSCWIDSGKVKAQASEYVYCPPKVRKHFEKFLIDPEDVPAEREARPDDEGGHLELLQLVKDFIHEQQIK